MEHERPRFNNYLIFFSGLQRRVRGQRQESLYDDSPSGDILKQNQKKLFFLRELCQLK
jgi:hypothetical protein